MRLLVPPKAATVTSFLFPNRDSLRMIHHILIYLNNHFSFQSKDFNTFKLFIKKNANHTKVEQKN